MNTDSRSTSTASGGDAPGWPGLPATWTSSAKSGVGTALSSNSRVWFTLSQGILDEIYYPRLDQACTRDMGLIVTDAESFFSEEKRDAEHELTYEAEGVPAFRLVNTCNQGRYRTEKRVIADPERDAVLQEVRFTPLQGRPEDYHLYVLLAPHLANQGGGNTAWVGEHKGVTMLFAQREGASLALACSVPWLRCSVGFVGTSDGWQDLSQNKRMKRTYSRAENGNVALTGEIDLSSAEEGTFVLSLGFGVDPDEAGYRALAGLTQHFSGAYSDYAREWQRWQSTIPGAEDKRQNGKKKEKGKRKEQPRAAQRCNLYRTSMAVIRTHEAKSFPGGVIASLSIPWGFSKGDQDLGGYHLVWPRDLVEAAGALLHAGAHEDARRVIHYLQATQEANGHWPQNMWMNGKPYWTSVQMDETALPILLVDAARRAGALGPDRVCDFWQMVRKAASCLVRYGPVTQEDRWEEDAGYTPFTLASEIAALLAAADLAEMCGEPKLAPYLRETADAWNSSIERWIYASGTNLASEHGVDGYYVRLNPPGHQRLDRSLVQIKNRPAGESLLPATQVVSTDALALVRFGLRAAGDPRITDTVKVIDAMLKVETPCGPAWHRYNDDGYGEHEDGSPYSGTGVGRAWPLLVGERAHFELAAGRKGEATRLAGAMEAFSSNGLLSEQVWDSADIPERGLQFGRPSGCAMPLVWANAEYVKLVQSLERGRPVDMPPQTVQRYLKDKAISPHALWRFNNKIRRMQAGKTLRVGTLAAATVHWSSDDWKTVNNTEVQDAGLGVDIADLPTAHLQSGAMVTFTFHWTGEDRWEGQNFTVMVD